ncbi:TetR/AcrR family transcriptional regulator [Bradyrhizobium manausense]
MKTNAAQPSFVDRGRSLSSRERLLEVAARHFAEHGIQGASQRAIQRELGVNNSTANYYFGSKEALYRAVIEAALSGIQVERRRGLEQIPATLPPRKRTRALLNAYLAPHLRATRTEVGYNYGRILAGLHLAAPDAAVALIEELVTPVRELYVDALSKLFPSASRNRIYEVLRLAVALMVMGPIQLGETQLTDAAIDRITDDVVTVATSAFETLCGSKPKA